MTKQTLKAILTASDIANLTAGRSITAHIDNELKVSGLGWTFSCFCKRVGQADTICLMASLWVSDIPAELFEGIGFTGFNPRTEPSPLMLFTAQGKNYLHTNGFVVIEGRDYKIHVEIAKLADHLKL